MTALKTLSSRYSALSLRERILVVVVAVAVVYVAVDLAWIGPMEARAKTLQETLKTQALQQDAIAKAMREAAGKPRMDPLDTQRAERDALRATLAEAESILTKASSDVRAGDVMRALVTGANGVTLVSLKTLPSQQFYKPVVPKAAAPAKPASGAAPAVVQKVEAPPPTLYRHGLEIAVRGSYPSLMAYLQNVERLTKGLYWGDARFDAQYPDSTLRFTLFVLSTQPEMVFE